MKKKRKKKVKTGIRTGKSLIIDDDVNLSDIKVTRDSETTENLLELADETPLIFNEAGTTVLSKDLETIRKKEDEKKAMWAPVRTFQDELSADKTDQYAKGFSPKRNKVRKVRHDSSSPERDNVKEKLSSAEQFQRRQRHDSKDLSPRLRARHDSASDQSPPRQKTKRFTRKATLNDSPELSSMQRTMNPRSLSPTDQSPPRRARHDSSSDQSPPRNQQNSKKMVSKTSRNSLANIRMNRDARSVSPGDQSPPRRTRHDSSSDQSPPRNRPATNQQRKTRHDSVDLLPQNRRNNRLPSLDQSPTRRYRHDSPDLSPPRRTRGSPPGQSPPRRRSGKRSFKDGNISDDQSPPRRKQKNSERKAGLHSAAELREENEKTRQRENEMFARMHANTTGRGAETVHRDKTGRKRDFKVEEAKKKVEERKKQEENEKFMEWGKGVKQSKSERDKVQDDLYEMTKPLARYKNDADLDQMLRDRERAEDPMLAFVQKKKAKEDVKAGKKEKPKYKGPAPPPNRFNIPPGYRWDGVDRSNGFEKKRFSMLANKGASREEAYKWSTEDM